MRKQNTTGDGKSAEVSMCREGQQDVGRISGKQQDAACGMLPACAPLANPFVPFQRDDPPVYAAAVGAVRGTLFPGLDLPLRGQENSGELGEYLDTHPGDARAAELFRSYSGLYAQAAAAWEAENGPIVQRSAVGESGYDWLRGPWPWQYAANDGEG